jgi:Zn-dependent peptidase ImmA (M78 family)
MSTKASRRTKGAIGYWVSFGHVVLHGGSLNRVRRTWQRAVFREPEWQANAFASAILMPENMVRQGWTKQHLKTEFGVTEKAARVRLEILGLKARDAMVNQIKPHTITQDLV